MGLFHLAPGGNWPLMGWNTPHRFQGQQTEIFFSVGTMILIGKECKEKHLQLVFFVHLGQDIACAHQGSAESCVSLTELLMLYGVNCSYGGTRLERFKFSHTSDLLAEVHRTSAKGFNRVKRSSQSGVTRPPVNVFIPITASVRLA